MSSPRLHGWFVAITATLVLLVRLGGPALWDDDEPKNAACSAAMLDSGDWVVPTFNGRLRVEKPPLVNWVQIAGFTLFGRNETGARIGSALLTVGTCLLTWQIGSVMLGASVGLLGGLAMASCVWTAVGGRAATPDAPLVFCTTLALSIFVRGIRSNGSLSRRAAAGVGLACGLAILAKGPVGLVMPMISFLSFAVWAFRPTTGGPRWRTLVAIRPLTITFVAMLVAAPWYTWVTIRTDGEWLRGFLLVHNVDRFMAPLEGHSGTIAYYPCVIACGLFPWSIVLAASCWHAVSIVRSPADDARRLPLCLLGAWMLVWIGGFSCSGTKLPGYVWPAYPALAIVSGLFLHDWAHGLLHGPAWGRVPWLLPGFVMRMAWVILGVSGMALAVALALAAARFTPDNQWLALFGLIPCVAAATAWRWQSRGDHGRAIAALAVNACLLVASLASIGAERFSDAQGARRIVAELGPRASELHWGYLWNVPPSLVFYTGGRMRKLDTPEDVARHLASDPRARVIVDRRQHDLVLPALPVGYGTVARVPMLSGRDYLLLGPEPSSFDSAVLALAD